jgi:hypothetical protein
MAQRNSPATRSCFRPARGAGSRGCCRAITRPRCGGARPARFCNLASARRHATHGRIGQAAPCLHARPELTEVLTGRPRSAPDDSRACPRKACSSRAPHLLPREARWRCSGTRSPRGASLFSHELRDLSRLAARRGCSGAAADRGRPRPGPTFRAPRMRTVAGATRDAITMREAAGCVILGRKDALTCGRQRDHLL